MEVALKVDVDTHRGLQAGVPRLQRLLQAEGVTASFFIAMGPDNSGKAVLRAVSNRGFLKKMFRTKAVSMYGLRTILSGTVLPSRQIALAFPEVVRGLGHAGFEVGVHGYDHVRWQDHIDDLGESGVGAELGEAFEVYRALTGAAALSFAAPGWRTSAAALKLLDAIGIRYHSDTRGRAPYRCAVEGAVLLTPEIPTTLPTMDEVMGTAEAPDADATVRFYLERFSEHSLNVHTIHAETEGMGQLEAFGALVRALKERGARFVRLDEVAAALNPAALAVCEVTRSELPGRAGWISGQGPEIQPARPGDGTAASPRIVG